MPQNHIFYKVKLLVIRKFIQSPNEIFSPIEVTFAGEPLATMRITAVDQRQSSGKVLNLQSTIQRGGRAVESSHAYPPDRLYLQILIEGDFPQD